MNVTQVVLLGNKTASLRPGYAGALLSVFMVIVMGLVTVPVISGGVNNAINALPSGDTAIAILEVIPMFYAIIIITAPIIAFSIAFIEIK